MNLAAPTATQGKTDDRSPANSKREVISPELFAGNTSSAASCACGGGCPKCAKNSIVQAKLQTKQKGNSFEDEADKIAMQSLSAPAHEQGIRSHVGNMLGVDFSGVRLHRETASVEAQGAHAMATGSDVYLAPGRYRPDLPAGRALIAHELTHVAQQGAAPSMVKPGAFKNALGQLGPEHSSEKLAEQAGSLADPKPEVSRAPLGMQQRCITGCSSCSEVSDKEDAGTTGGTTATPSTPPATTTPTPTHSVGPSAATAGAKVVRLAWTIDDGPTPHTAAMSTALTPRASTWFIMSNLLGTGAARTTAMTNLVTRQTAGDEIGVHSFHPTLGHSAWLPINLGTAVPKGYTTTASAMADLTSFTTELRGAGLNVHFGRMPGGELSEVKKYILDAGGSASTNDAAGRALLAGGTHPGAPAVVATDVALIMSTLRTLNLHLWGGSATGPEVTNQTWEAESSGVASRTDDVVRRFKGVVDRLAAGTRTTPGSFVILAHDTSTADVTQAGTNIAAMETYATSKGVRIEYYTMADLYTILRGAAP